MLSASPDLASAFEAILCVPDRTLGSRMALLMASRNRAVEVDATSVKGVRTKSRKQTLFADVVLLLLLRSKRVPGGKTPVWEPWPF